MKSKLAAIITIGVLTLPTGFALAEHGPDNGANMPPMPPSGAMPQDGTHKPPMQGRAPRMMGSTTAQERAEIRVERREDRMENGGPGKPASTTIKARIEDRMEKREDKRDEKREDRRDDRRDHASSTSSSTHPMEAKRPLPKFLGWIFGHTDTTTLGEIKAEVMASSSESSVPARAHFILRVRNLFGF